MISLEELENVAKARLEDSIVLSIFDRHDGAVYLCGYALEIALKVKAVKINGYFDFPETPVEFRSYSLQNLKTHNLNSLLRLSGLDSVIKADKNRYKLFNSVASNWSPEYRYRKISGKMNETIAFEMIEAAEKLLPVIL